MDHTELGELRNVNVRKVWAHEAINFTPWLSENLDKLADKLGVNLELEGTEVQVGRYRADIVAHVPENGARVLIENQIEDANLQHLGQVLAYLAGLEAKIVVWVATGFDDAHLSAIRWLNEHTPDPFAFFAVGVGVVQIGDSLPAPVFEVLERPNEWNREVQTTQDGLTKLGRFRQEFWAHMARQVPDTPDLRPGYAASYVSHPVKEIDVRVTQYLASDQVGVYINGRRGESVEDFRTRVEPYLQELKQALEVDALDEYYTTRLEVDSRDRENWDRMADWLDERRRLYNQVLCGESISTE